MAIVKTLDIILRAQTGKLENDLKKTHSLFSKAATGIRGLVSSFAVAAVSGLTFAGAMAAVHNQFRAIDEISDTAKTLGTTSEAFERLAIASDLSGVNVEMFSKIAGVMSIKAFEAANGSKQLAAAFTALGIDSKAFVGLSMESKIIALAKAFATLDKTDPMKKMVVASQLFGKQWRQVLPLLDESADHLARAAKWSAVYQLPFTVAQVAMIEETNRAWKEFQTAVVGVARKVAIEFAPALTVLFRQMAAAIKPGTAMNSLLRALGDIIGNVVFVSSRLLQIVNGLNELFGGWLGKTIRLVAATAGLVLVLRGLVTVMKSVYALSKLQLAIDAARAALGGMSKKDIILAIGFIASVTASVIVLEKQLGDTLGKLGEFKDELSGLNGFDITANTAPVAINQQSATLGSQAAFEQLYKVQVTGPVEKMVEQQKMTNEILEQMKSNGIQNQVDDFLDREVL